MLSVVTKEPVRGPVKVGTKLKTSVQLAPAASEVAAEVELSCGQVELVLKLKLAPTLGFFPVAGIAKASGALPLFATFTVFGLSELVEPGGVEAKASGSGFSAFNHFAALLPLSAT